METIINKLKSDYFLQFIKTLQKNAYLYNCWTLSEAYLKTS